MVNKRGFSIPEVLMAGSVAVVLIAAIICITAVTNTSLAMGEAKIALQENGRRVMERLTRELRQANEGGVHITQVTVLNDARYGGSAIEFQMPLGLDSRNNIIWGAIDENNVSRTNYKIQYISRWEDPLKPNDKALLIRRILDEFGHAVGSETIVARNLRGGVDTSGPNSTNPLIFIGKRYYKGASSFYFDNPNAVRIEMSFQKDLSIVGVTGAPQKVSLFLVSEAYMRN